MYKLGYLSGESWLEYSFPPIFQINKSASGTPRLRAGVPGGDNLVFERLALCLEPPCHLLYILHTSRGEAETGRYQSPGLSAAQLSKFVKRFETFLSSDARFDIWAYSPQENATVIWDRHNMLYGYGPIEKFSRELRTLGFNEGNPETPHPHEHHYRQEMDGYAKDIHAAFDWIYSPLRPEDEQ